MFIGLAIAPIPCEQSLATGEVHGQGDMRMSVHLQKILGPWYF